MSDVLPERVRARPSARVLTLGVVVLVVLALLGGVLAARARAATQLLLVVDGTPTVVRTDAGTVGELLAEHGVLLGARDRVAPDAGAGLDDVRQVDVAYARPVLLEVDGAQRELWTTSADVGGLLAELGLPADVHTSLPPLAPLPRVGAELTIRTPKQITAIVGGRPVSVRTTAATVRDALAVAPVSLRDSDEVTPADPEVLDGATYVVTRVRMTDRTSRSVLRADTTWVSRADLPAGTTRVLETGRDGVRERRVRARYVDGTKIARRVRTTVVSRPVDWVIAVGTRSSGGPTAITYPRAWTPATGKVAGEPDFAALARCESGGNPRAVSPTGKYRGLYQFDLRTWHGVGGVGDPIDATPEEQTKRARILYEDRGRAPWPYCGRFL